MINSVRIYFDWEPKDKKKQRSWFSVMVADSQKGKIIVEEVEIS